VNYNKGRALQMQKDICTALPLNLFNKQVFCFQIPVYGL